MGTRPARISDFRDKVLLGTSGNGLTLHHAYLVKRDAVGESQSNYRMKNGSWSGGGRFQVEHTYSSWTASSPYVRSDAGYSANVRLLPNIAAASAFTGWEWYRPWVAPAAILPSYKPSFSSLNGDGATGWKRTRPGKPMANFAVFVGELRHPPTIPRVLMARAKAFRDLGSDYLNVNFGWKPFVSDLRKMYETYVTIDRRLAQLVRDNGRGVRRRTELGNTETTTSGNVATKEGGWYFHYSPASYPGMAYRGGFSWTRTQKTRTWYVAKYRYYIPDVGSSQWTKRATRALYGVNITPEVVWELIPWSWLIDYFSNVGDIVSNLSTNAASHLTADYAYVMRTTEVRVECRAHATWDPYPSRGVQGGTFEAVINNGYETKTRQLASPYGFGVNYDGLSAYQMSILAALGISRSRF